jgi:hypothetical protein
MAGDDTPGYHDEWLSQQKGGLGMCNALNTHRILQDGNKREETHRQRRSCSSTKPSPLHLPRQNLQDHGKGDVQCHLLNSDSYVVLKTIVS